MHTNMSKIIEVAKLDKHPMMQGVGRTLRIYFDSGFRVSSWEEIGRGITISWNSCQETLPEHYEILANPIIEEHRDWLLGKDN